MVWTPALRLPKWTRPWERTKDDLAVEAATVVTSGGGGNVAATTSSTLAVTIASPSSGNLLLVASSAYDNISSISGGGVTTWTNIEFLSGDTSHDDSDIWYGVVDGTSGTTVTITYLSSMGFRAARVLEITGAQKATDATVAFANDAQGSSDSKSISTVTDGCCIISVLGTSQNSGTAAATGPTGYTQLSNEVAGVNGLFVAYLNQATHGSSTMNWSGMNSKTWPSLGAVAVEPAAGAGLTYDQDKLRTRLQAVHRGSYYMSHWRRNRRGVLVPAGA